MRMPPSKLNWVRLVSLPILGFPFGTDSSRVCAARSASPDFRKSWIERRVLTRPGPHTFIASHFPNHVPFLVTTQVYFLCTFTLLSFPSPSVVVVPPFTPWAFGFEIVVVLFCGYTLRRVCTVGFQLEQ